MFNPPAPSRAEIDAGYTDPDAFEFVELFNASPDTPFDLTGVRLVDGVEFGFTGSAVTTLGPGSRVLVTRNEAAMNVRYPGIAPLSALRIIVAG